jgi:hypothetical protein
MKLALIAIVASLLSIAAIYFGVRFATEYRKVKRQQERIRGAGRTKSAIRAMRRDVKKARKSRPE